LGKIDDTFKVILSRKKKAFIPFFTAFYPTKELFREFLMRADDAEADFIEIGIPFSDPLADGELIQYSSQWALERRFSLTDFFEEAARMKNRLRSSLILMSYLNPLLQRGISNLGREMEEAGIEGVIVPDLPFEESSPLKEILSSHEVDLIYLVAPPTGNRRMLKICQHSQGFIYLVSLSGVTGMRQKLPENLADYIKKVREITAKPLCVGFGISNTRQASKIAEYSDGIIVGSMLINLIKGRERERTLPKEIGIRLKDLREVI